MGNPPFAVLYKTYEEMQLDDIDGHAFDHASTWTITNVCTFLTKTYIGSTYIIICTATKLSNYTAVLDLLTQHTCDHLHKVRSIQHYLRLHAQGTKGITQEDCIQLL